MIWKSGVASLALTLLVIFNASPQRAAAEQLSAYSFQFQAIEGHALPLSNYRGKALLVVNTASLCGFTRQYNGLQALWEEYRDRGLVVLGVPSNDFGGQEPGTETEIKDFCETNFGIDFPMTRKQHVRGPDAHPLYQWLKGELGTESVPRWNFHKYLIGRNGQAANYFASGVRPDSKTMREAIEAALAAKSGS
jgi:glutathione peroxidase